MADFVPKFGKPEPPKIHEILKKLRSSSPEWYDKYVAEIERDYQFRVAALLKARQDEVLKMQGAAAAYDVLLRDLKQAQ